METREEISSFEAHTQTIRAIDFNTDQHLMVTASFDKSIGVWDTKQLDKPQLVLRMEGHVGQISGVLFFGYNIISTSHDETIRVWDICRFPISDRDYTCLCKITAPNSPLTSLERTHDGSKLVINTDVNKVIHNWKF